MNPAQRTFYFRLWATAATRQGWDVRDESRRRAVTAEATGRESTTALDQDAITRLFDHLRWLADPDNLDRAMPVACPEAGAEADRRRRLLWVITHELMPAREYVPPCQGFPDGRAAAPAATRAVLTRTGSPNRSSKAAPGGRLRPVHPHRLVRKGRNPARTLLVGQLLRHLRRGRTATRSSPGQRPPTGPDHAMPTATALIPLGEADPTAWPHPHRGPLTMQQEMAHALLGVAVPGWVERWVNVPEFGLRERLAFFRPDGDTGEPMEGRLWNTEAIVVQVKKKGQTARAFNELAELLALLALLTPGGVRLFGWRWDYHHLLEH